MSEKTTPDPNEDFRRTVKDTAEVFNNNEPLGTKFSILKDEEKPFTLELTTDSGKIALSFDKERGTYSVVSSEDPSMREGKVVVLDGATLAGVGMRPDTFAPNTRISFRQQMTPHHFKFGSEDTDETITKESYDKVVANGFGRIYELVEDGVIQRAFDPTPRATGLVGGATLINEDGVRTIF